MESLCDDTDVLPNIPPKHRTGICRSLARDFFQDNVKVNLCISNAGDDHTRDAYCGCAAGGGTPDFSGAKKRCPSSDSIMLEEQVPIQKKKSKRKKRRPRVNSVLKPEDESQSAGLSKEEQKCKECIKLMDKLMDGENKLNDVIFYKGRATTTKERVRFNKKRNKVLNAMHPRTDCDNIENEICVVIVNFISDTAKTSLCLQQAGSEDTQKFCGCVAKAGTPSNNPFVCPQ